MPRSPRSDPLGPGRRRLPGARPSVGPAFAGPLPAARPGWGRLGNVTRTTRHTSLLLALATLLAAVGVVLPVGAAAAHSELMAISPKNGATVSTPPTRVVLTFSEDVNKDFSRVKVLDEKGGDVSGGDTQVSGNVVSQPLEPDLGPGTYHIAYKIVSADGHPVSGTSRFTVAGASASPSASASSSTSAPAEASTSSTPTQGSPTTDATAAVRTSDDDGTRLVDVVGLAVGGPRGHRARRGRCGRLGAATPGGRRALAISHERAGAANVSGRAPLAQLAEQLTLNQRVRGSSP